MISENCRERCDNEKGCTAQFGKNETATMFCLKSFSSDEN